MYMKYCPSETEEEIAFSDYCKSKGYTHWHVPQETFTKSWKQKQKNKEMGVMSGVSDHWVKLPTPKHPNGSLVVIELKRQFGNTPTDEQINFMLSMEEIDNVTAVCCYGAEEAIKVCKELNVGKYTTFDLCWERTNKLIKNRQKAKKMRKITEKPQNNLPY